jgi:hypothetical protein
MQIDYGKIIDTAKARRTALEQLTELVNAAPAHLDAVHQLLHYYQALRTAWNTLDKEGRALLPADLRNALEYASPQLVEYLLFHPSYSGPNGLKLIAGHATTPPPSTDHH